VIFRYALTVIFKLADDHLFRWSNCYGLPSIFHMPRVAKCPGMNRVLATRVEVGFEAGVTMKNIEVPSPVSRHYLAFILDEIRGAVL
jgi:hypothetical protein